MCTFSHQAAKHEVHGTRAGLHLQEPHEAFPRKEDIKWGCLGPRVKGTGFTVDSSLRKQLADPWADLTTPQQ